jgi:hypothetical protein
VQFDSPDSHQFSTDLNWSSAISKRASVVAKIAMVCFWPFSKKSEIFRAQSRQFDVRHRRSQLPTLKPIACPREQHCLRLPRRSKSLRKRLVVCGVTLRGRCWFVCCWPPTGHASITKTAINRQKSARLLKASEFGAIIARRVRGPTYTNV